MCTLHYTLLGWSNQKGCDGIGEKCTNVGRQVAEATKIFAVARHICGASV